MRDIEFRAWHPERSEMVYFDPEKASRDEYISCHFFELMAGIHETGQGLMQYTGLKDSKGVKIFEGDVIESKEYPFYGDALEFKYDELNYLGVVGIDHDGSFYELIRVSERVSGRACGSCLSDINNECYVIGNIYEHPHLIENKEGK